MAKEGTKVAQRSQRTGATHVDARVRTNLGRRIKDKADLERAVTDRCATEFYARWPEMDPNELWTKIHGDAFYTDFSAQAAACLSSLRASLKKCWDLLDELTPGEVDDVRDDGNPNPLDELSMLRPELASLEARWLKVRARWNDAWFGVDDPPKGIGDPDWRDWRTSGVVLRRIVYAQCYKMTSQSGERLTDRDLAIVSLLAGVRRFEPAKRGTTTSEIITLEAKAMRSIRKAELAAASREESGEEP